MTGDNVQSPLEKLAEIARNLADLAMSIQELAKQPLTYPYTGDDLIGIPQASDGHSNAGNSGMKSSIVGTSRSCASTFASSAVA